MKTKKEHKDVITVLQEASGAEADGERKVRVEIQGLCSGYIPLLPAHLFNTWLAFSELSALWTCRQAGLIWERM